MTDSDKRKQVLRNKVYSIWKALNGKGIYDKRDMGARNLEEAMAEFNELIYAVNVRHLKDFLIDRNGKGEKPDLIVESPYTDPRTGLIEDRGYMPNEPKYNQEILDMLKKQQLIPEDSTIDDYDFLLRK